MATNTQLKYAQDRLRQLHNEKLEQVRKDCTTPEEPVTVEKFLKSVKDGKIKAMPGADQVDVNNYGRIREYFDLTKVIKPQVIDEANLKKRQKVLNDDFTRVMDQLMLGDAEVALKLLKEFADTKF